MHMYVIKYKANKGVVVVVVHLSDHKVLHNIASSSSFRDFARIYSLFLLLF